MAKRAKGRTTQPGAHSGRVLRWDGSEEFPGTVFAHFSHIQMEGYRTLWVPKTPSPHAAWEYSRISPLSRSLRRTRIPVTSAGGWMRPAGGFCCNERCGRCMS